MLSLSYQSITKVSKPAGSMCIFSQLWAFWRGFCEHIRFMEKHKMLGCYGQAFML